VSKKGLGRGLQALIADDSGNNASSIREIPLDQIEANPSQPRKEFGTEALEELAASLRSHGLLQPILVRPAGLDRYYIIAGERRYRAAQLAGFERIACLVQACSEQESAERALIENIQRADLSPVEEGLAYQKLIDEYGLTQEQVAQRVGKGRATIANLLSVIRLPSPVLQLLEEGKLSQGHAKLLTGIEDSALQVLIAEQVAREKLSVRGMEELLRRLQSEKPQPKARAVKKVVLGSVSEKLSEAFQTKVAIKGSPERGRIEIEFYSGEELNRLLELWRVEID